MTINVELRTPGSTPAAPVTIILNGKTYAIKNLQIRDNLFDTWRSVDPSQCQNLNVIATQCQALFEKVVPTKESLKDLSFTFETSTSGFFKKEVSIQLKKIDYTDSNSSDPTTFEVPFEKYAPADQAALLQSSNALKNTFIGLQINSRTPPQLHQPATNPAPAVPATVQTPVPLDGSSSSPTDDDDDVVVNDQLLNVNRRHNTTPDQLPLVQEVFSDDESDAD